MKTLCNECKKVLETIIGQTAPLMPWAHCHHNDIKEPINRSPLNNMPDKEPCWCVYKNVSDIMSLNKEGKILKWEISYCPVCGKKLEEK